MYYWYEQSLNCDNNWNFEHNWNLDSKVYNVDIKFVQKNNRKRAIISRDYYYRRDFEIGDIVTDDCETNFGYVCAKAEDEVKVDWGYVRDWEYKNDLLIIPSCYSISCLSVTFNNYPIPFTWKEYISRWREKL